MTGISVKIAVIGAGLAGLYAADRLRRCGHSVKVFEKSRGRGGRLANKRLEWGSFDMGAQYFTARSARFQEEVERLYEKKIVKEWSFVPYKVENGALLRSPDNTTRYICLPRMNGIAHDVAYSLDIVFETHVKALVYRQGYWTLMMDDDSETQGFDWVVVSCPAEQSKALLQGCSDLTQFITDSLHAPCWTLGLETNRAVDAEIQGVFGDELISWVSRQSSKPGYVRDKKDTDHWVLHFSPAWSLKYDEQTKQDILATGVQWLESVFQCSLEQYHYFKHYWRYASLRAPIQTYSQPYLIDASRQVSVVGDWCCGGRVEGAFLSAISMVDDCFG
ncbi:NAD(P)-binding protein [Endozoicomonas sp.]|nr:NAD(P)-binding protein [Endozoicomonas sp.]